MPGRYTAAEVLAAGTLTTAQDQDITVANPGPYVNGYSLISVADLACTNGVVHLVDTVLMADDTNLVTAASLAGLTTLLDLATAANLAPVLSDVSKRNALTVLAPTNAAFADFFGTNAGSWVAAPRNSASVVDVLNFHVVTGIAVFSRELVDGQTVAMANGESNTVRIDGNGVSFLDNQLPADATAVVIADVATYNGVAHVIDHVLLPAGLPWGDLDEIVTIAQATPDLSTLVQQLVDAQFVAPLEFPAGPFTVLAPNNAAFVAAAALLPSGTLELQKLLGDHVLVGRLYSDDLQNKTYATVGGGMVECVVGATSVQFIDDGVVATVLLADVDASNGVVHVIDKVLVASPPSGPRLPTIAELAIATPSLSTLVAALSASSGNLVAVLNSTDVYTVFAPTNSAFDKPPANLLSGDLYTTLLYHVVAGNFTAAEVLATGTLTTVQGRSITIATPGNWVNDYAQLITVDVPCSNGVVHIIDGVLIAEDTSLATVAGLAGLNTLLTLATAAGLADQLADVTTPNAVTLWAPTDAAFASFFSTNVGSWVAAPRNSASVAEVLKFHVVPSDGVFYRELADGQTYATATGESVKVRIDGNGIAILDNTNGASFVETPDLVGFNGVAQIVDRVLVPTTLPWEVLDDIVTLAQATPQLSTLVDQLGVAQFVAPLQLPNGPFTVLAPNNDAFTAAGADLPTTIPELQQLFGDHVLIGRFYASDLKNQSCKSAKHKPNPPTHPPTHSPTRS